MRLRFESTVDGLQVLRLHCVDTLVAAVRDSAGRGMKFELKRGVLHIPLRGALARGAVSSVEIEYTSKPRRGLYFHSPGELCPDRPNFMYSQGQSSDNRRWIPCYDQPDDRCRAHRREPRPECRATHRPVSRRR